MTSTKIDQILKNPNTPGWLLEATRQCLKRDPVDAANEAEFLAEAMQDRVLFCLSQATELAKAETERR